ncbi:CRAL-TRIO domain and GOLD domain and CRAL/TRIO N-terminal domain-containing protein [Trichostrongylus colubriformis]|uniref:CRAL-TRIO domain and GOLD domain and CRAL/TRIO N-terminal domain-containing protein n=1 Tax=Trichostrongylus colubriformis TaxID=6319 RepID=A0AAN8FZ73_TRICO
MTISSGISQDDRLKIAELRKLVKDDLTEYYDTDFNLLRWLQGHAQLEVKDIARKLRHHLKARKSTWDLDNMHKLERTHPIHNHWRYGITGESDVLDNVIINIEQCGRTDYTGMMECFSVAEVMRARIYDLEVMLAQCMELEKRTGRQAWILYVMDVTGLEYNKKLYDLVTGSMRSLAEFMADHYVEMIKFFVLVNIPSFAVALWTVVRPLLPERTKSKVRILSSSNWKDEILQFSKKESLPAIWSDDTHVFPAHVDPPQQFLKEWYYSSKGLKQPENVQVIDVPAGKHHVFAIHLQQGDVVSWWVTGNRNFGFGFFRPRYEDDNDFAVMDQLIPTLPWMPGPTLTPVDDSLEIAEDGLYKFWISNERAWWWSLCAHIRIEVNSEVQDVTAGTA